MEKIIFILMVGSLIAQSKEQLPLDELILLNDKSYVGKYISSDSEHIVFKPEGVEEQIIVKSVISRVTLGDGTIIFTAANFEKPKYIDEIKRGYVRGAFIGMGGILLAIQTNNPPEINKESMDFHQQVTIGAYVLIAIGGILINIGI